MSSHAQDVIRPSWRILYGDVRERAADVGAGVAHCCVTSPPYWNLRSYLPDADPLKCREIGREETLAGYLAAMVDVFRAVRGVLRPDGVLFLNLGDGYADREMGEIKTGDVINVPHAVASALRDDGWHWRDTIVWAKAFDGDKSGGSSKPESVSGWRWERCRNRKTAVDCPGCKKCEKQGGFVLSKGRGRCVSAHEYLFVLTPGRHYFWDSEAIRVKGAGVSGGSSFGKTSAGVEAAAEAGAHCREYDRPKYATHGRRDVWFVSPRNSPGQHFATYPAELIAPAILAATSDHGVCGDCGMPWARVIDPAAEAVAWRPCCKCTGRDVVPAVVFDPFAGSGTTLETALMLGRHAAGVEISKRFIHSELLPRLAGRRARAAADPEGQKTLFGD